MTCPVKLLRHGADKSPVGYQYEQGITLEKLSRPSLYQQPKETKALLVINVSRASDWRNCQNRQYNNSQRKFIAGISEKGAQNFNYFLQQNEKTT